jgi:CheY-like chemotaxis protein
MPSQRDSEALVIELRNVLQHLYDPAELRKSPLSDVLVHAGSGASHDPASVLRRTLTDAIRALRPGNDVPAHANAWRVYHVLAWRYVEGSSQRDVASSLSISPRQLRRLEWDATRVLADYLWRRYALNQWASSGRGQYSAEGKASARPSATTPAREQELEWLKASFPSETTDITQVMTAVVKTIQPLAEASHTQVVCHSPKHPIPVTGQLTTIRQALLNVATAAVHAVPGGEVRFCAEVGQQGVCLGVRAEGSRGRTGDEGIGSSSPRIEVAEHLQMAYQLVPLFQGQLDIASTGEGKLPFAVTLMLPATEQTRVLVIDDNADTLHLLQRYLVGTRYTFVGTRDPEEALPLAEHLAPQIIVLDIMLPGIDGWELLGRLREHPRVGKVPVLVCSILPQAKLAVTLGAAAYLRKPVSRQALLEALDHQLSISETPDCRLTGRRPIRDRPMG